MNSTILVLKKLKTQFVECAAGGCILDHNQEKNEFFCFVAKMFPSIVLSRRTSIPLPVNDLVKNPDDLRHVVWKKGVPLDSVDVASFSLGGRRVHFLFHFFR